MLVGFRRVLGRESVRFIFNNCDVFVVVRRVSSGIIFF